MLIVEDDPALAQMLALHFEDLGYQVFSAASAEQGQQLAQRQALDVALLDQQLPDGLGIELLPKLLQQHSDLPVIMMTGEHDLELAIEAIKLGAADFVHKPVRGETLQAAIDKVLGARSDNASRPAAGPISRDLIGRSAAMLEVSKQIALCAQSRANVLIQGESGTGKEVVARLIHQHSGRSGDFIAVNCAAIVDTLLESELFGHEKGAFTGAEQRRIGRFEQADGGTLLLDEIGEMPSQMQAKLLRTLQERSIERVGGNHPIPIDVRVIAATHRDLMTMAGDGRFREDLAYRLNVVSIALPPLRERREDIPLLADALLARIAAHNQQAAPAISDTALQRLAAHDWPGNVRELENVLTEAMVYAHGHNVISPQHLHFRQSATEQNDSPTSEDLLRSLEQVEAEHIQRVLAHTGGHKGRSCEILGISRPALDRKILKYGLRVG
jgi:DNA-binding NtrC family response regulator